MVPSANCITCSVRSTRAAGEQSELAAVELCPQGQLGQLQAQPILEVCRVVHAHYRESLRPVRNLGWGSSSLEQSGVNRRTLGQHVGLFNRAVWNNNQL